jgi:hypothetical protein
LFIRVDAFQRVGGVGEFGNRVHPFMHRAALPVPVFVGLHLLVAVVFTDCFLHTSVVARVGPGFNPFPV